MLKTAESLLFFLGTLMIALIALYGVSSLIIRFSPQPVSGWLGSLVNRSTPGGWNINPIVRQ